MGTCLRVLKMLIQAFFVSFGLVASVFFISSAYLNAQANQKAQRFCDSVTVGEPLVALQERAKQSGVELERWVPEEAERRYIVWFSGFYTSAAICDIAATNKVVVSKYVRKHKW